ncbi:rhomboid family intramembrane serine protease [Almyronema epifaneia]|uniref:Rhomboid family intramembrane serine protease n=1 Tax=Almyronema epifaneia S1 TaxID=2991925 RepID=A0ABW6IEK8_9CYAN
MDTLAQYSSETLTLHAQILGGMVAVLWGLELVDSLILQGALNRYGIRPRRPAGLSGIILAPLLHGNLKHLSANTLPLVVLGWFILLSGVQDFVWVTAIVWLVSGLGVWLLGQPRSNHIGASGIVFGYLGFLLMRGYVERSPGAIAIAVLAGFLYGGSIWGVLPLRRGQSWQGHLFGLLGGGLAAYYLADLEQWL